MAGPGNGEFPMPLNQYNSPLLTDDEVLGFMAEMRPTREELMAKAAQEPPHSDEAVAGEGSAGSPMDISGPELYSDPSQFHGEWNTGADYEAAPPSTYYHGESSRQQEERYTGQAGGYDSSGRPLSILPEPVSFPPLTCCCCQVLREIVHTNGVNSRKLEIHGRFGILSHAILQEYLPGDPNPLPTQYEMFDFSKRSTDEVKQFIMQYYLNQIINNYAALPEPLSDFYDVLCVGIDWADQNMPTANQQQVPLNPGGEEAEGGEREREVREEPQMEQQEEPEGRRRARRTALAMQRQRTGRMTLYDLKDYLHLPISEAAKKMNLCLTVVKKICRRSGLRRWPYRKVMSYQKKMAALRTELTSRDAETRETAAAEMERLRQELSQFCAGIVLD